MKIIYDENKIVEDIKSRKFNYSEIANRNNVKYYLVYKIARKFNIGIGNGRLPKDVWIAPSEFNEYMFYIIGAFLTDGSIHKRHNANTPSSFCLAVSDYEFAKHTGYCLEKIGLICHYYEYNKKYENQKRIKDILTLMCSNRDFAVWLNDITKSKNVIPDFIKSSNNISNIIKFIDATIDGDGYVAKDRKRINVCGTCGYIKKDFCEILDRCEIRNSIKLKKILDSGKEFYEVNINFDDYVAKGGCPIIKRKAERIFSH